MLGIRLPEIAFGALLTIAVFAIGFSVASQFLPQVPQFQAKQEPAKGVEQQGNPAALPPSKIGEHPQQSDGNAPQHAPELTVFRVRVGEGVLAIATVLLVVATWVLVVDARHNAQRQSRAYVSIFSGIIRWQNIHDTQTGEVKTGIRISVELRNSGQTPAYNLTTWIAVPQILGKDATPWGERGKESKKRASWVVTVRPI
jgi:hypothetical protein